jgi:hypothetical protein
MGERGGYRITNFAHPDENIRREGSGRYQQRQGSQGNELERGGFVRVFGGRKERPVVCPAYQYGSSTVGELVVGRLGLSRAGRSAFGRNLLVE